MTGLSLAPYIQADPERSRGGQAEELAPRRNASVHVLHLFAVPIVVNHSRRHEREKHGEITGRLPVSRLRPLRFLRRAGREQQARQARQQTPGSQRSQGVGA